jgi:hypothetical protein
MISQLAASHNLIKEFASRGFVIFSDSVMCQETLAALRLELDRVLRGESGGPYDSHALPTKVTCIHPPSPPPPPCDWQWQVPGRSQVECMMHAAPSRQPAKTLQMINIHKASLLFKTLATCPAVGEAVCALMGWDGVRFCQDQVCRHFPAIFGAK